ncbi:PA14 domain-containing protein [Arenibacter sp. GZD96]|uniref:PA14 domain-containing protein n=1 Tax=Aurantibrevibacter litoralis TaxID=3106030 RepID=UPI002AFFC917|nr:PA14 domain-containing protein [Arenibacter sp. GZD-96]MEA1786789.1 PA14 domain-containing protein [Arenibacter sp. GZD-96]
MYTMIHLGKYQYPFLKTLFLLCLLLSSVALYSQTTIWSDDFSYSNNTTSGMGTGVAPATWSSGNGAMIRSNSIETRSRNVNGFWRSNEINITGFSDINLSFTTGTGSIETTDRFSFRYRLDGGTWTTLVAPVLIPNSTYSFPIPGGTNLELEALFSTNENNDRYRLDSMLLTGIPPGCSNVLDYEFYDLVPPGNTVDNIPISGALNIGQVVDFNVVTLQNAVDPGDGNTFAIRYTGYIQIATAGSYTFFTTSDDGSKLFIDDVQIVNNDGDHGAQERSGTVILTTGLHRIRVLFYENGGGQVLEARYQGPSVAKQLIPFSLLSSDCAEPEEEATNEPPTLTATGNQLYCGEGASIPIAQTVSITDADDTGTSAVYIQVSSGYVNGEDLLSLTGSHPGITASWDAVQGKITLQGPASYSAFENAILSVVYSSSNPSPTGNRQFSITVGEPNFLPTTGHYYEFVSDIGITWANANTAASARTYFGLQGYLATLTSQEESDFAGSQISGAGWIGASDATTEGVWRWVTGPEAGTQFWNGGVGGTATPPFNYAFWNSGEPNNSGDEDYAHITENGTGMNGSWNDLSNTGATSGAYQPKGYVVEYGGMSGDPILNVSATTTLTMDNIAPTWVTVAGTLNENYQCAADVPTLAICTSLSTTFFNQQQFAWGFGLQNTTANSVPHWEVRITNANYQLNPVLLSNPSAFVYSEEDNGDGTYNLIITGTTAIPAWGSIPGGNIEWSGVNFGFTPTSDGISLFCGDLPFTPPVATDSCGTPLVHIIGDTITYFGSENDFVRVLTYEAVDTNGNTSIPFTKTITVKDTTLPTATSPDPITVFCSSDIPAPDVSVITDEADNCTANPMVVFLSDVSDGGTNPEIITRTYEVTDDAGNRIALQQLIKIQSIDITVQPMITTSFVGHNAAFSVLVSNGDTFQWQVSTDNGLTFSAITDGVAYSGTQTSNLQINNVNLASNGSQFRVVISQSGSGCAPVLSLPALLSVKVATVISNRRITHRVNP